MSTVVETPQTQQLADASFSNGDSKISLQQFELDGVTDDQFVAFSEALGDRFLSLADDGDRFESLSPGRTHERRTRLIGQPVEQLTLELNIPLESGGSTTFRNQFVKRGLDPDDCLWVQHCEDILGVEDWKAELHPPPDPAIEIDVTSSSIDRQGIDAKLGVPELWQSDGKSLRVLHLNESGEYNVAEQSLAFPCLTVSNLLPFVTKEFPASETEIVREFVG